MRTEEQAHLKRCSLSEVGIEASGVKRFLDEIEEGDYHLHTFMIVRHGKVAYECSWAPYELEEEHLMHSFTKGLVATAIGILEGEGRISLDDPFPIFRSMRWITRMDFSMRSRCGLCSR